MLDTLNHDRTTDMKRDAALMANCFTAGYTGAKSTIAVRDDKGPDLLRPRAPAIYVGGHRFLPVDFRDGAVVHDGATATFVRRAVCHSFVTPKGITINTLKTPSAKRLEEVLVMADIALPDGHLLKPIIGQDGKAYVLHIQRGLHHNGEVLLADGAQALVRLSEGQFICLLFPDGLVLKFVASGGALKQEVLTFRQMALVRVEDAKKRFDKLSRDENFQLDDVKHILSGMVDLLHRLKGEGAEMARAVVVNFFFKEISDDYLSFVHRKLTAVLHAVDPIIALGLQATASTVTTPGQTKDAAESARRRAEVEARRAASRATRDELSQRMKGSSSGGGDGKKVGSKKGK